MNQQVILKVLSFTHFFWLYWSSAQDSFIEEVFVTAEKRSESLQDISQAVTAISDEDIDNKTLPLL